MINLRPYQAESIQAIYDYWANDGGNPLIELATGLGKSVVIAELMRGMLESYPDMRLLMLVHVRELVEQNYKALKRLWPEAPAGVYSAGLNLRQSTARIVCASIQSVFRKPKIIGPRDLILIDEAHLVPHAGEGMYQALLAGLREQTPDLRVVGLTATPFRLDSGRLDHGDDRLFDRIVYSYDVGDGIEGGWLSPLRSRLANVQIDVTNVPRRGAEFVSGHLERAADQDALVQAAADELLRLGAERKSWLIFCSGVRHAQHVCDALRARGIGCETVSGETPNGERDRILRDFKAGRVRAVTNMNVLTTGFDAPGVDLIAMLRPTLSTGLYVQMLGRGTRIAPEKTDCIVLDFSGNIRRHGPVNLAQGREPKAKQAADDATLVRARVDDVRSKTCPGCGEEVAPNTRACPWCGHEWPVKHERHADVSIDVIAPRPAPSAASIEAPVYDWDAARHVKKGGTDSVRVTYRAGLMVYSEWLCPEHVGFPHDKFLQWWAKHGAPPAPATVSAALARFAECRRPETIFVRQEGKFWRVVGRRFPNPPSQESAA